MERKETWVLDDVLAKFIMDKKEDKGVEFDVLIKDGDVLEFWWFSEPTEEWSTMFMRYTDHSTHCANTPLNEPTFWEIKSVLMEFFGNF